MENLSHLITAISQKGYNPSINLDRPIYIQPEDRIQFRAARLIVILGMLNTTFGLSKNVIACVDFLLRNEGFQFKFIMEYFAGQKNILQKISSIEKTNQIEIDFNIVQYKSVPWDIRFNDMFLFLYIRKLITYKEDNSENNLRILLTDFGKTYYDQIISTFPSEINFLELFGKRLTEEKTIKIITEIIPNSYWKQNGETYNQ